MPTFKEGPRAGCAVPVGEGPGENVVVGLVVGAREIGDGVAELAVVLLAAL